MRRSLVAMGVWGLLFPLGLSASEPPASALDFVERPTLGRSVVYFFNLSPFPVISSLEVYENEDPLPFALGGKEYYRHECDPGKRIFWVPPLENIVKVFGETFWIHADFQPDQVYVARITYNPAKRGQMKLFPLTPDMSEWSSIQEIARSKPSQPTRKIKGNQKEKMKKADGRRARYEERRRAEGKKVRGNYAQTILGKISKKEEKDPSLVRYLVPLGL